MHEQHLPRYIAMDQCNYCGEYRDLVAVIVYEDGYWCKPCRDCFGEYMEDNEIPALQKHPPDSPHAQHSPTRPA